MGEAELEFLSRHKRIGLDTALFIYYLEGTEPYSRFTVKLFTAIIVMKMESITRKQSLVLIVLAGLLALAWIGGFWGSKAMASRDGWRKWGYVFSYAQEGGLSHCT